MDAGTVEGKFTLDTKGFTDGVKNMERAVEEFDSMSDKSFANIEAYAKTLMDTLNNAYQGVAQNSATAQAAQEAYNAVLRANESILAEYGKAAAEAEQRHAQAQAIVSQKQNEYNQALQIANQQLQRYNELKEKEGVNQRSLQANYEKYVRDLQVAKEAQKALDSAQKDATKAQQDMLKAKQKYADVAKAADTAALKSQQDIEKANTKTAETIVNNAVAIERARIQSQTNIEKANITAIQKSIDTETKAQQKAISDIEKAKINAQAKIEKANIDAAERAVEKEVVAEKNAAAKIEKAKIDAQAKIEKAKIDAAQKSADNEKAIRQKNETEIEKAVINAEAKLQQTKIREAEKGARQAAQIEAKERQQATRDAQREQERAARDISDKQVMAFAVAAKAVDEVVNGVKRLAQELLNLSKQVVQIGADFETSMAQVAATSGMTAGDVSARIGDYQDLVDAAKEAGLTTIFSASQAGEALNYLALAGYNVEQSIETMPDILTIAAAGAMDLGRASDMVTDAMNALDLSIEDTNEFIDKMAKTAQSSNTNVEQLGNAILTVGGTATVLSGGVTELDTALGLLANAGIKARVGGTALRQILLNLTDPSTKAAEKIEELGLEVFDLDGNIRPLKDIFTDLNNIMADFTDQERMEALGAMFDKRQIRSATALMQAVGEKWDTLEAKINNANGAAERMAETMRSNLNGALNIAKSNLENIAITIYDGIVKNITSLVKEAIPKFQQLNKVLASPEVQARLQKISKEIRDIGLNLLDKVIKAIPEVIKFFSEIEVHVKSLAIALSGLIAVFNVKNIIDGLIGIATALKLVKSFVLQNPYAILAIAMAEVLALVIELDNAITQQYKNMAAQVRAETDLWEEQRSAVENVTNDWNSYLETQGDSVKSAEDHAEAVRQLYYQYMNLVESGKDATLALEALKEEVPGLQAMLDDGKDSFEDITKAVDDYTEALLRSARAEAGKDLYIQAFETQAKAQRAYDDATEAVKDNEKALKEAEKAVEGYSAKFDDPNFAWDIDELERLKETRDALKDTLEENKKARDDAQATLNSTTKAMERAEADYTEWVKQDGKERGEIFDAEVSAKKREGEDYAKASRIASKKKAKAQQEENEDLLNSIEAGLAEVERKIALSREDLDQAKIDYFSQIFGSDDWDKNNQDLVKYYDDYMSLREKKEKEVQDKIEKAQKERENNAKKAADDLKKSIDESVSDIEWLAGFRGDTADKQAKQLREFVDQNASYYQKFPEEYDKMVQKIAALDKQWLSNTKLTNEELKAYLKDIASFYGEDSEVYKTLSTIVTDTEMNRNKEQAEKFFNEWTTGYNNLADKAVKAYQDIQKSRESFEKNLLSGAELFTQSSEKVFNRFTQEFEEVSGKSLDINAFKDAKKELDELKKVMGSLQVKGLDEGLLNELWGMKPEEALEAAKQLDKQSVGAIQKLNAEYKAFTDEAAELSEQYYQTQISDWEEKYWTPLQQYVSEGQADLKKAMALVGEDTVNGFIEGLQDKVTGAEDGTKQIMTDVLTTAKDVLGIHSPSTVFHEIGENTIQGFLNGIHSKIESVATIFLSLGQRAGDSFVNAFKETWDNFVTLMNTTGGLAIPNSMVATTYGTPVMAGNQMVYSGIPTSYGGLTKDDIVSAVREALPGGDVSLTIDKTEFAKVSRDALNSLTDNGDMGLKI